MAVRGERGKPTALKILQGEKRPERLNPSEPKPERATIDAPAHLNEFEKKYWNYYFPILYKMNIMTLADAKQLEIFCEICAEHDIYRQEVIDTGRFQTVPITANGEVVGEKKVINPAVKHLVESRKQIDRIGGTLGLNPADRGRLQIAVPSDDPGEENYIK